MYVANYSQERRMLAATVDGQPTETAIFLSGPSNYGKTYLLKWLEAHCAASARVVILKLAEADRRPTPLMAMHDCVRQLGWRYFQDYKKARDSRPTNTATVKDLDVKGSNVVISAIAGTNPEEQRLYAVEITDPFITGLAAAAATGPPIVICVDGLCSAAELTREWVETALVAEIARIKCVRLIITGRTSASDRLCDEAGALLAIKLNGVHDICEWTHIAQQLGAVLPGETQRESELLLRGCIEASDGEPSRIMRWLMRQAPGAP